MTAVPFDFKFSKKKKREHSPRKLGLMALGCTALDGHSGKTVPGSGNHYSVLCGLVVHFAQFE